MSASSGRPNPRTAFAWPLRSGNGSACWELDCHPPAPSVRSSPWRADRRLSGPARLRRGFHPHPRCLPWDLRGVADRLAIAQGLDDISGLRLPQVDSAALEEGMAAWATDHAPASVARAWAAWSSFFTYLISQGIARANPTEMAERPKPPPPAPGPSATSPWWPRSGSPASASPSWSRSASGPSVVTPQEASSWSPGPARTRWFPCRLALPI
jgi:hypothetical protein